MNPLPARRLPHGLSLVEALIALLITGTGLLVLATTQMRLVQSADAARQRGEATRLAAERIESARAFTTIAGAGPTAWNGLSSGSDSSTSNVTYTRSWTLDGDSSQPMRQMNVAVNWTDRNGAAQAVAMSSVISRTDPADVGMLSFPLPGNSTLKRPKNRNMSIPVPAVDLGNGQSVAQINSSMAIIFANDSGGVVKTCNGVVNTAADTAACTELTGYILTGFISLNGTNSFPSALGINTAQVTGSSSTTCYLTNAIDQNTNTVISNQKYYLCLVRMATAGNSWSGTLRFSGMATGADYLVCRFQYDATPGVSANQRNVQPYNAVAESLDQQNYVLSTTGSCPTVSTLATVSHQNCSSGNAGRASECPAS